MAGWSAKDPNDVADHYFDWGSTDLKSEDRFLPDLETITAATVTVPAGLTNEGDDFTDKVVRVRLSGGTAGTSYSIDCLITTSTGQQFEVTRTLQVKERIK